MPDDNAEIITITLEGPGLRPGRISLAALSVLSDGLQKAVTRMTASLESKQGRRGARVSKEVLAASELDLTGIGTGSVKLLLRPRNESLASERTSLGRAVTTLVTGIRVVRDKGTDLHELPTGFDVGVVRALLDLEDLYRAHGITEVSLKSFDGSAANAVLAEPQLRILENLRPAAPEPPRQIIGRLMGVNHKTSKCTVYDLEGHAHQIPFDPTLADDVDSSLRGWVRALVSEGELPEGDIGLALEGLDRLDDEELEELSPPRTARWPRSVLNILQSKASEADKELHRWPELPSQISDD
jgi:hypothetical protein